MICLSALMKMYDCEDVRICWKLGQQGSFLVPVQAFTAIQSLTGEETP